MPIQKASNIISYNFESFRASMGEVGKPITKTEAAEMFGVSQSTYWRMEKVGLCPRVYAWAAYGMQLHKQGRGVQ